jgi:tight adherence protein B
MISVITALAIGTLAWSLWQEAPALAAIVHAGQLEPLRLRLAEASVELGQRRLLAGMLGLALALGLAAAWGLGSAWALLPGAAAGLCLPWAWVRWLEQRKRDAFAAQLVDCLELMASAMRAGQSLQQALASVATEAQAPSAAWWGQVASEVRLGAQVEDALDRLAQRFDQSPSQADLTLLATAVAVQRSAGGNLAEIFGRQAETLRERARLRAQISALTAQGRLSGWVVGLLPVFLLAALNLVDPELVLPLVSTPQGWAILAAGLCLELCGAWMIRKIVRIDL